MHVHRTNHDERLVLNAGEAAELLGISRALVYELCARGEIPHLRLGRRVVIPRRAFISLINSTLPYASSHHPPSPRSISPSPSSPRSSHRPSSPSPPRTIQPPSTGTDLPLPQSGSGGSKRRPR